MSLRILQKTLKNLDFWKTCVKISYVIHPKASIHTKRSCGPIEKSNASTFPFGGNFDQFHRANLSEISSTCIGTVRHTIHKFLGFFFFSKIPTGVPIFVEAFSSSRLVDPFRGRFFVRSWVAVYSLSVLGLPVYSLMMAIFMSSGLQFLPLPFDSWLEHVSFSSKTTFSLFEFFFRVSEYNLIRVNWWEEM